MEGWGGEHGDERAGVSLGQDEDSGEEDGGERALVEEGIGGPESRREKAAVRHTTLVRHIFCSAMWSTRRTGPARRSRRNWVYEKRRLKIEGSKKIP